MPMPARSIKPSWSTPSPKARCSSSCISDAVRITFDIVSRKACIAAAAQPNPENQPRMDPPSPGLRRDEARIDAKENQVCTTEIRRPRNKLFDEDQKCPCSRLEGRKPVRHERQTGFLGHGGETKY